jgi:hypothetical protein
VLVLQPLVGRAEHANLRLQRDHLGLGLCPQPPLLRARRILALPAAAAHGRRLRRTPSPPRPWPAGVGGFLLDQLLQPLQLLQPQQVALLTTA